MKTLYTAMLMGIVLLLSFTASAQKVVEGSLGNVSDKPQFLGFFVPDGAAPIPGILIGKDGGYFFMFHQSQAPGIHASDTGYFCLQPRFYYGEAGSVIEDGDLAYLRVDAQKLGASGKRLAMYASSGEQMSKLFAAVPENYEVKDNGDLKVNYKLMPVKKSGGHYRIQDFLYTKSVVRGVYPLFGRAASDSRIVFLGYLGVESADYATVIYPFSL